MGIIEKLILLLWKVIVRNSVKFDSKSITYICLELHFCPLLLSDLDSSRSVTQGRRSTLEHFKFLNTFSYFIWEKVRVSSSQVFSYRVCNGMLIIYIELSSSTIDKSKSIQSRIVRCKGVLKAVPINKTVRIISLSNEFSKTEPNLMCAIWTVKSKTLKFSLVLK